MTNIHRQKRKTYRISALGTVAMVLIGLWSISTGLQTGPMVDVLIATGLTGGVVALVTWLFEESYWASLASFTYGVGTVGLSVANFGNEGVMWGAVTIAAGVGVFVVTSAMYRFDSHISAPTGALLGAGVTGAVLYLI